jgi:hypothetical protein
MNDNDPNNRLDLLLPWDLPSQQQLNEVDKNKVYKALKHLLQALKETSHQKAFDILNEELANLEVADVLKVEVSFTETSLKGWEVEDFDNYFEMRHIQTQESVICLVRSIILGYKTFLEITHNSYQFDPIDIEIQKRGFEIYAHLLARVFKLCLEET